jgi:hypothetical protein
MRATYRVIREPLSISDTPHSDDFRTYPVGSTVELDLCDAILLLEWRKVAFDGEAASPTPALA